MEDSRAVVLLLVIFTLMPGVVFSYERNTHKGLAQATVKAFLQLRGEKIGIAEQGAIVQGGWDEDDDWRFMRHFFDPINNRGLTKLGQSFMASKYWAQDTEAQGDYNCYSSWLCNGPHIGYSDKFFSSPTDFSWDRAVYEYVYGDKTRAASALGHILHLLQDASVPAHVRNDAHPNQDGVGDADPYEHFTSKFGEGDVSIPTNVNVPTFVSIAFAFDSIANFTNGNFVSKDTLKGSYIRPDLMQLPVTNGYINDSGHKIARAEVRKDFNGYEIERKLFIDDDHDAVASDYWRVLSKKAIETGVGVIDLFFREVEKEKKTGELKAKNVSAAEIEAKKTALAGFKIVKALYGSSLDQSDVADLLNDNSSQAGAAAASLSTDASDENPVEQPEPPTVPTNRTEETETDLPTQETSSSAQPQGKTSPPPPTTTSSGVTPGFGGGGASSGGSSGGTSSQGSSSSNTSTGSGGSSGGTSAPSLVALPLYVGSPANSSVFATSSVAATGTTTPSAIVNVSFGSTLATTSADTSGNWSYSLGLAEGSNSISFASFDTIGDSSATTTLVVTVDTASPNAPSPSVAACARSIASDPSICLLPATSTIFSWTSVSDAAYYRVAINDVISATTTATSLSVSLVSGATTALSVVSIDSAGNAATSTIVTVIGYEKPLVINEIAWMGTKASSDDEWIEVKNSSPYTLDLSRIVIRSADGAPYIALSGTIASVNSAALPGPDLSLASSNFINHMLEGFFTIERRAEAESFSQSNGAVNAFDTLSDTGEQLFLEWNDGSATTTVDSTPAVATCSGWCAGSASAELSATLSTGATTTAILTMERARAAGDGTLASNWHNNDYYWSTSGDANGDTIYGTPGWANSAGVGDAGWYCSPDISPAASGGSYKPTTSDCTYLSRFITNNVAFRSGGIYRGTPGSSTAVSSMHFSTKNSIKAVATDDLSSIVGVSPTSPASTGEQFFMAIWEERSASAAADDASFDLYLRTGINSVGDSAPPHNNYRVILWTWAP